MGEGVESLFWFWLFILLRAYLVAQIIRIHLQCRRGVQTLGQEDPLEKGMATHSSLLAQRIPWTEEPGGLQSMGLQRVGHDQATNTSLFFMNFGI